MNIFEEMCVVLATLLEMLTSSEVIYIFINRVGTFNFWRRGRVIKKNKNKRKKVFCKLMNTAEKGSVSQIY